jgi:hypothetical protein
MMGINKKALLRTWLFLTSPAEMFKMSKNVNEDTSRTSIKNPFMYKWTK